MPRRVKRRGTPPPSKRPAARPQPKRPVEAAAPQPEQVPEAVLQAEAPLADAAVVATNPRPATASRTSRLPRRQPEAAAVPASQAAAQPAPLPPVAAPSSSSQSLLPRRDHVQGRAERRRAQEAALTPMEDSPAIPMDRTPYLGLDLRRVMMVSSLMLLLVILGFIFLR